MKTPSATGLLRFALAILVVVAVLSLAASLQLSVGEGGGLPELGGLPVLGVDPILLVWIFGIGSVVLFLMAFLLYRPRSNRGSLRGVLAIVLAVSLLIFFSYLLRPSFPLPDSGIAGPGTLDPPGGNTGTGSGDSTGGEGPGTPGSGSGGGDGTPGGTGAGTGTGDGTGGTGSGTGGGDPGGTGTGTTPGGGEAGSGGSDDGSGAGTGTGGPGGDSDVPGEGPPGPEPPLDPEDPGTGQEGGTTGPGNPGTVVDNPVFPWSALFTGAFLLFVAFLVLVAVHVLRGTLRSRQATTAKPEKRIQSAESLRAELLAAFESLAAAEEEGGLDARATILASYGQMLRLFRASGLNPGQHLTAREVEDLAMERFRLSPGAAREVRRLFEEARYSVHRLGKLHRREVIESLRRVRSELVG